MLRDDNDEDAVLARNATPVFEAVAVLMRRAPSMPYTDFVVENVSGQIPEGYRPTGDSDQFDDPNVVADLSAGARTLQSLPFTDVGTDGQGVWAMRPTTR